MGKYQSGEKGKNVIGQILKLVVVLAVLGFAALSGYAYLADLSPEQQDVTVPVNLNAE